MKRMFTFILALMFIVSSAAFAEAGSQDENPSTFVINIDFSFTSRENADLEQINKLLAAMEVNMIEFDDFDGYLAKETVYMDDVPDEISFRYGFDEGTLICTKTSNEKLRRYRLDQCIVENGADFNMFIESWKQLNPGRKLNTIYTIEYDTHTAYIILNYEDV